MHCDYGNHTLAYPPDDPAYWQTAYLLYYTDVTENHAPTAVCSRKHYPEKILVPAHYTREQRPSIYDNEVKVVVPAGSLFIYSMRTFHRGTAFLADGGRPRAFHHLCAGCVEMARNRGLVRRGDQNPHTEAGSNRRALPSVSYWASHPRAIRIGPRKRWPASVRAIPEWTWRRIAAAPFRAG